MRYCLVNSTRTIERRRLAVISHHVVIADNDIDNVDNDNQVVSVLLCTHHHSSNYTHNPELLLMDPTLVLLSDITVDPISSEIMDFTFIQRPELRKGYPVVVSTAIAIMNPNTDISFSESRRS